MAIIYTWIIKQLECSPQKDGLNNVVQAVHWRLEAVDGDYRADIYGSVGLPGPGQPFIAYDDLTQTQVIGWVENVLGVAQVDDYKNTLAQKIANQINPTIVTPPLPWQP